jgi:hypothetical protein
MQHSKSKLKLKDYLIGIISILAIIAGIALTPYQANADSVTSIAVDQTKTTLIYKVGSTILTSDIYISINQALDSTQCSTIPDVVIDVPENTAVGRKTVTITYGGQITSYEVKVVPTTPTVATLKKLDFDTVKAYSTVKPGLSGVNFAVRADGSATAKSMGLSTIKSWDSKYFCDTVQLLKPGKTYWFKVRTYVYINGERFYSDWSTEKSISLPALTGVNRWRYETKRQLLAHGVYSKTRENIIINIINHESGGNERAGAGRTCVGLLQFSSCWTHNYSKSYFALHDINNYQTDNRLSGSWSLHRVAMIIKAGGTNALKQYWPHTWNL